MQAFAKEEHVAAYPTDEVERMGGLFRPLGRSLLRTHLAELFYTIRARLGREERPHPASRPDGDAIALKMDTYNCGAAPCIAGVITDPFDGQQYRLLLVPAIAEVRVSLPAKGRA